MLVAKLVDTWRKATAYRPLVVLYQEDALVLPDGEVVSLQEDPVARLSEVCARFPALTGLEVHYQGCDLLVLVPPRTGAFSRYVADKLPPGRQISDYLVAHGRSAVALLPLKTVEPFLKAAAARGLMYCRFVAFSSTDPERCRVRTHGAVWRMVQEGGHILKCMPEAPGAESLPIAVRDDLETADWCGRPFDAPLFTWIDPLEPKRLEVASNRRLLKWAAAAAGVVLLLSGVLLQGAVSYYDDALMALSADMQQQKADRRAYTQMRASLDEVLAQIADATLNRRRSSPRAALMRRLFNDCPELIRFTEFALDRRIEGTYAYVLTGTSPDPKFVDDLIHRISVVFPNCRPILTQMTRGESDPAKRARTRQNEPPYSFRIEWEES